MDRLPVEIIQEIFHRLNDSRDIANFSRCNRALYSIAAENSIWVKCLHQEWKYIAARFPGLSDTRQEEESEAREMFRRRKLRDSSTEKCILAIVENPRGRLKYVQAISDRFVDSIDAVRNFRLKHGKVKKNFAIDYYCKLVEQHLSRKIGIYMLNAMDQTRVEFATPHTGPLAGLYALNCFRGSEAFDVEVEAFIAKVASSVVPARCSKKAWDELPLYRSADDDPSRIMLIIRAMTEHGIVGATPDSYYDIGNTFISNAMLRRCPTIPITMVAIFVAVCGYLGLDAHPIPFPGEVLAVVKRGEEIQYITPYRQGKSYSRAELEHRIYSYGLQSPEFYMSPCAPKDLCERAARNLLVCIERGSEPHKYEALYCAVITLKLLGQQMPLSEEQFISLIALQFQYDILIWEKLGIPEHREVIQKIRLEDVMTCKPKLRYEQPVEIRHRVGTIFQHATFNYHGIITGWDYKCEQSSHWIDQMRVNTLERKAQQPFYNVLAVDGSERYVAEDNVLPLTSNETPAITNLCKLEHIGKYFKSYDGERFIFSSDLAEMYPQDL